MHNRTQTEQSGETGRPETSGATDDAPQLLVVDDDTVHRMIICRIGAKVGYVPVEATSYDEAAKLLQERMFDCISLDLSLGGRGGVDVLRLAAELGCKTPIIIISGSDPDVRGVAMDVATRLALNVYEPLPKPVNLGDLRQSLLNIKLRTIAGLKSSAGA